MALRYLDAVAPARVAAALEREEVLASLEALTSFGFTTALGSVDWCKQPVLPDAVFDVARRRKVLSCREVEAGAVLGAEELALLVGANLVSSDLLAAIARSRHPWAIPFLLEEASDDASVPDGGCPDAADAYRAHALWLAAVAAELGAPVPSGARERGRVAERLASRRREDQRAAAALVLATQGR